MSRDGERASGVIQRIRGFLTKTPPQVKDVDINHLLDEAVDLVQTELRLRDVVVRTELTPSLPPVPGDSVQLQQLVLNLLLNAADAMSGMVEVGGVLIVATDHTSGSLVHLSVSDTGTGIKPEILTKIFDPLITTKPHGLGLGLSISRAVAEAHDGSIWAVNNPGRGATFHALFPASHGGQG